MNFDHILKFATITPFFGENLELSLVLKIYSLSPAVLLTEVSLIKLLEPVIEKLSI